MKTRIITAIVGMAILLLILFIPWLPLLTMAAALIASISVYEILTVTETEHFRSLRISAIIFALIAPFFNYFPAAAIWIVGVLYVLLLVLLQIRYHDSISLEKAGSVFLLSILIAASFSCLSYIRTIGRDGLFFVILALVIAWMSDTGAYFIGSFFGKHPLCPNISPKKTVEGFVGGIAVSILSALLTAWIYQLVLGTTAQVHFWRILALAFFCAPLSVVGDLFASMIKRHCGVKDYGNIFPGHGGMLDRFDSLLFVLPVVYLVARFIPMII